MREVLEAEAEAEGAIAAKDAAKLGKMRRLAVRRQAHHFEFVAEFPEAEVLGDRAVVHAQGMRESHRAVHLHAITLAGGPHGTGEIAQTVSGEQCGLLERRDEERTRQERAVVLDAVELRAQALRIGFECLRERFRDTDEFCQHLGAFSGEARHAHRKEQLGAEAGPRVSRHGYVIDFGDGDAGFLEAIANGRDGNAGGVLDAIEALLFDGRDQPAVGHQCGGGVTVVGVDP